CACNTPGTVNGSNACATNVTGQCSCKASVEGRACDRCKDGFYGLSDGNINGCLSCDCDVGSALNQLCNKESGQCVCRNENILGRRCDMVRSDFYYLSPHGIDFELEYSYGRVSWKRDQQNAGFSDRGYAVVKANSYLAALLTVPETTHLSNNFSLIVRYRSSENINLTIQILSMDNSSLPVFLPACSNIWCEVNTSVTDPVTLQSGPNLINITLAAREVLLDKLVAFPVEFLQPEAVLGYSLPAGCDLMKITIPSDPVNALACQKAIFSVTMFYLGAPLPCSCDVKGSISATCNVSGGQCQCQPGVIGRTCDRCSPDHYGFSTTGCTACNCDEYGTICDSVTGQCQCPDNTMGLQCEHCVPDSWGWNKTLGCQLCECNLLGSVSQQCNETTGICACKMGVEGAKCDLCVDGFFNLTTQGCSPCMCNEAGSAGSVCNKTTGQCLCKENTGSRQCDTCLPGTFGLDSKNPMGCLNCICMGVTNSCVSAGIKLSSRLYQLSVKTDTAVAPALNLVMENGSVANASVRFELNPDMTSAAIIDITAADPRLYWQMPDTLLTSLVSLYGTDVLFTVNFVIVEGVRYTDPKALLLRKLECSCLRGRVPRGERCACGLEYTGSSCEMCAPGYRRENVTSSQYLGVCVPCMCHGHSTICNAETGVCQDCLNNTEGANCENCSPGFYGNATIGTEVDCMACPCYPPRVINATCEKDSNSTNIVCSFCQAGYVGIHCDECDDSYNGSPKAPNGTCLPCECNDNAVSCDSVTGHCISCTSNTTGTNCERCISGFYGNASQQTCQECQCVPGTSNSTECDFITGQCSCVSGVGGRSCDQCLMGFWGYNVANFTGCKACGCVEAGSLSVQCYNNTGQCSCRTNATGSNCDVCIDGFYGLPSASCQACSCDPIGSLNISKCNMTTGQCECRPGIGGRQCNQCLPLHVNFTSAGCQECGLCQKSLGDNIANQSKTATEILNKTQTAVFVQMEDGRLQALSFRLNESLSSLGLAGSNSTSVNDILDNVTSTQMLLVSGFEKTKAKVSYLTSAVQYATSNGSSEVTRQLEMSQKAGNLSTEIDAFETSLSVSILYLTTYNNTASQYLNRTAGTSGNFSTFEPEKAAASLLLSQAQNTSNIDSTSALILQQAADVAALNTTIVTLASDINAATVSVVNLTSVLETQSFSATAADNSFDEAMLFKTQAEELKSAVLTILNKTEQKNTESTVGLSAARAAARNTNTVYSGDAPSVMVWISFPSAVTNFENGISKLKNLQTLVPILADRAAASVYQSESHVDYLEQAFANLSSVYQNVSSVGKDAVEAIDNYKEIVSDLDAAVSTIATANRLILEVQSNFSGDGFNKLQEKYSAERASSDILRQQLMELDYGPQVLQSLVDAEVAKLDKETAQWAQADVEIIAMRAAAQPVSLQIAGNTMNDQTVSAVAVTDEILRTAASIIASTTIQDNVLTQKQAELDSIDGQINQTQQLQQNVGQLLIAHQIKYEAFQRNLTTATSLGQTNADRTKQVADKIQWLQSKLERAESLLEKLQQPVSFDGNLSLELKNPVANVPHLYDNVLIEMKRPADLTDGIVFFVDSPTTSAELEIGLSTGKIFFEFNTGFQNVRVTSLTEICSDCWVKIYASRYGTVGHLTVIIMSTGGIMSNSQRGSDDVNARQLTVNSDLYLGSLPNSKQTTKVASRIFRGCLYNVKYQNQLQNLWTNVMSSSQKSKCCQSPPNLPMLPVTQGTSFSGLEFRTVMSDAALLKVTSTDGKTNSSLFLSDGYVVWETLSGAILSRLQSQYQYTSGQWVQILTERETTERKLTVKYTDSTVNQSVTSVNLAFLDLSNLDNQNILIGSAADPLNTGYAVSNTNFAGCLRNFIITTSTGTTTFSLKENIVTSLGVTSEGCYEKIVSGVAFTSLSAYAQLVNTDQIQQLKGLEVDVITNEPQGIIAYIGSPGALRFLYLALFGGNVIVVYNQNITSVVVSSGQFVSDGQKHTIKLDCTTLRVSLNVDNNIFEETSQTLSVDYLAFPASAMLQIGGVMNGTNLQPECPVTHSLIGGISRLSVNSRLVPFLQSNILTQKDVTLAGIPASSASIVSPSNFTDPVLVPCVTPSTPTRLELNAGLFINGTSSINWSDLAPNLSLPAYFERSFAMDIDFAAFKADGVLFYVSDLPDNPSYYLTIYLLDGFLHLRLRTSLKKEHDVHLLKHYSNGQRYTLRVMKINDFASLVIDSEKDYVNTEANANITSQLLLPASVRVYLGGIGSNIASTSALPQKIVQQPSKMNFAGAVYSVSLKSQDVTPSDVALSLGPLDRTIYPAIPKTAYYGVSLTGSNSYLGLGPVNITEDIAVEIQFTSTSESGLLLLWYQVASSRYLAIDIAKQQ
ncbi:unnamed protein product, partial [Candidula unifasciata]